MTLVDILVGLINSTIDKLEPKLKSEHHGFEPKKILNEDNQPKEIIEEYIKQPLSYPKVPQDLTKLLENTEDSESKEELFEEDSNKESSKENGRGKLILLDGFKNKSKDDPSTEIIKIIEEILISAKSGEFKSIIFIGDIAEKDSVNLKWSGHDKYSVIGKLYYLLSALEKIYGYKI